MSASDRTHTLSLVSSFFGTGWRAECSCGWSGPQREDVREPHVDFARHRAEAEGEPSA